MTTSSIDMEFRRLVANTARQLTSANLEELHYIYNLPVQLKDCSALSLLQELQQRGHFSSAVDLGTMLRSISREDLAQAVGEYRPFRPGREFNITLAQLRAKCDANISHVYSLVGEFKKIQEFLRHGSLPPDNSVQLWQHFEEFEKDAYALLGRCESAHKCYTVGQSQSVRNREGDKTDSISSVGPPQNRGLHIHMNARVDPGIITSGQKHPSLGLSSAKNISPSTTVKTGTQCPACPAPPPPDTADKEGPDYDEPDLSVIEMPSVKYYASKDLVGDRKDLQTAQNTDSGCVQECPPQSHGKTVQPRAPLIPPPLATNRVQSIAQKMAGCSIAAARTAEIRGMGMAKTQKGARPQVPKKPGFKSGHTSGIPVPTAHLIHPASTSSPNLAHHTSESDMEESGYSSSSSGSAGSSVAEWTKGSSLRPPSKEWPSSLREQNYYKGLNRRCSEHTSDYL